MCLDLHRWKTRFAAGFLNRPRPREVDSQRVDLGVEPLFEAIQEALPGTQTVAPLHRRAMCFDIGKK
jgi:hypothetical protein